MRSIQFSEFGIDKLDTTTVPDAVAGAGEVLIANEAATINPADVGLIAGAMTARIPAAVEAPYVTGWDLAGRVVAVGDGVDENWIGKRVVGFSLWFATGLGTQSSLVALPLANVAEAPDGLTSAQLTTLGLNGLTAWKALDKLALAESDTLAVVGAAGSVGGFAVELAVSRGIRVIGIAGSKDRATVLEYGAEFADRDGDLTAIGADALLDTATLGAPALAAIRDGGRYMTVTVVPESERDISVRHAGVVPDAAALATLIELATAGRLHTPVARTFDAADAIAAYTDFATNKQHGRVVLTF